MSMKQVHLEVTTSTYMYAGFWVEIERENSANINIIYKTIHNFCRL